MKDNKTENEMNVVAKYGAYVVLMLCIIGVAIAAVLMVPPTDQKKQATVKSEAVQPPKEQKTADEPTITTISGKDESFELVLDPVTGQPIADKSKPVPDFSRKPEKQDKEQALLNPPVEGEVIWGFAMNELIYSKTLDQWTTHAGVDIACKKGDKVRTVKDGIVDKVYKDDAFGVTVVIKHSNGDLSLYSNLGEDVPVTEGDRVAANQTVGTCGNTAIFECESKPHLHFEYHRNGKPIDPCLVVRLSEE